MFAPNTRIAFTKKLVASTAHAQAKTTARYNETKQRSVEAMDLLLDSSADMWKLYKWDNASRVDYNSTIFSRAGTNDLTR